MTFSVMLAELGSEEIATASSFTAATELSKVSLSFDASIFSLFILDSFREIFCILLLCRDFFSLSETPP